jgi:hypothetical protein
MFRTSTTAAIIATAMLATPFAVSAMAPEKTGGAAPAPVEVTAPATVEEAKAPCPARPVRVVYAGYGEAAVCAVR